MLDQSVQRQKARLRLRDLVASLELEYALDGFDADSRSLDLQGWGSEAPIFARLIDETRPSTIVEVGTWKGASAIHMAMLARRHHRDVIVLCLDTWLGGLAAWSQPELRAELRRVHGWPTLYYQFLANVVHTGLQGTVVGWPVTSATAVAILTQHDVTVDLIYIDGSHLEREVALDLEGFWPLLESGGVLFGDDYSYPGVRHAVEDFADRTNLRLETDNEKWLFRK